MTNSTAPILHVVFGSSAAASLRQAIADSGRNDEVVGQFDALNFGPIDPPDPVLRAKWVREELGWDWGGESDSSGLDFRRDDVFWHRATTHEGRAIAWFSRRCTSEYTGFLEFVWRLDGKPYEVVDITDVLALPRNTPAIPRYAVATGIVSPREFFTDPYFGSVKILDATDADLHLSLWGRLRRENAPLRVLENHTLISAPLDYFDDSILSHITPEWRKAARVVGDIIGEFWDTQEIQLGDDFYWSRIQHLAAAGRVEARGDLQSMRLTEIRRKSE